MNKSVFCLVFIFALLGGVFAQQTVAVEPTPVTTDGSDVNTVAIEPLIRISLVSPVAGSSISYTGSDAKIEFVFSIETQNIDDESYPLECLVSVDSDSVAYREILDLGALDNSGAVSLALVEDNYEWKVSCKDSKDRSWFSSYDSFKVEKINSNVDPSPSNPSGGGSRGGIGTFVRLVNLNNSNNNALNFTNLTNPNSPSDSLTSNSDDLGFSRITGALIGVFGKRGTIGIGVFLIVLGIIGLFINYKDKLGFSKKN